MKHEETNPNQEILDRLAITIFKTVIQKFRFYKERKDSN